MTPNLKHSSAVNNHARNLFGELHQQSQQLSLLSQISTGSRGISKKKKQKANSHDAFGIGILDKDDSDVEEEEFAGVNGQKGEIRMAHLLNQHQ